MRDPHPLPGTDHVVHGVRLHVVGHGRARPGAVPLVLLHGLPTSSYLWRDVMRDLEHDVRTIAPDLVGLGRSERPRGRDRSRLTLATQAARVLALLDALGLDRVAVAGHDLGGAVAVHLTALAPERVAGLVLVDAPVHADLWPPAPVLPLLVPGVGEAWVGALQRAPALAARVLRRALGAPADRELRHYVEPLLAPGAAAGLLRLVRAVDPAAAEAALRLVCAGPPPALVLWGERDRLFSPAYGRRLAGELGASWVPVGEAGHLLPQERPQRVAEEIAAFLAELPAPTHPPLRAA